MAKVVNLQIDQASTFSRQLTAKNGVGQVIDLTPYEVIGNIKKMFVSFTSYPFTVVIDDAPNGLFTISLTPEESAGIPGGRYVYDIITKDGAGNNTRIYEGIINMNPAVTEANPFTVVEGIRITDPNLVHAHDNLEILQQIDDLSELNNTWEKVDEDDHVAINGGRYLVETGASVINIIVPDEPENDYKFSFEVMDNSDTFGTNKCIIKNETGTVIYEGDMNGENFRIVWTNVTEGYKIIQ